MKKSKPPFRGTRRTVTIKDVARKLGVAPSTVARALADHPLISAETKERVRRTTQRMGYVVNSAARVMRGGMSSLIGLVIPDIQNDFYASIAKTLSQVFERKGLQLLLSIAADNPSLEQEIVSSLISARAAGIVIVPTPVPTARTLELLARSTHIQFLRRIRQLPGDWFGIEDEKCICSATNHLIALGHRQIGYIGGNATLTTGESRLTGFVSAFTDAGLPVPRELIQLGDPTSGGGRDLMSRLLRGKARPSAVVMGSLRGTFGAIQACQMGNVSTPEDISLVGFGDAPGFQWWRHGLTTMSLPVEELASDCAEWLFARLKQGGHTGQFHEASYPCSLILRGSSAPPKVAHALSPSPSWV